MRAIESRLTTRQFKELDAIWVNAKRPLDSEYLVQDARMKKPRRVFARSPQGACQIVEHFEKEQGRRELKLPVRITGVL